tara:strand:- start:2466 stop:3575 length:1110 start_codon:yes stop_codon:yes gene_type:complete
MKYLKTLNQYAQDFVTRTLVNLERGKKHTDRLHGPSGIGKTAIIEQLVDRLSDATATPWGFATINVGSHGALDLIGVPDIVDSPSGKSKTIFAAPDFLPDLSVEGTPAHGIFFIDEIDKAQGDMVNALMPLLYEGKTGGYTIPDGWVIIGAQNRLIDSAGSRAVANVANVRRAVDVGIYACPEELCNYAVKSDWHPYVSAFLDFRPEHTHEFPEGIDAKKAKTINGFACPATWEMTSDFMFYDFKPEVLQGYLADGILGESVAAEFCQFLQVIDNLPDWKGILTGDRPEVERIDIRYALISVLAHRVGQDGFFANGTAWINAIAYCHEVLGAEFGAIFVRRATSKWPGLLDTDAYINYKRDNQDLFITS